MIRKNKINPDDLKVIRKTEIFQIEEIGNNETGEIHNEMFIRGLMSVDEILYAVKKYNVEVVHYTVGTDKTHTFPLLLKTTRSLKEDDRKFDVDNAQSMYPVFHEHIWNGKEWRYIYNHSI